jgi:hypothetical protein
MRVQRMALEYLLVEAAKLLYFRRKSAFSHSPRPDGARAIVGEGLAL